MGARTEARGEAMRETKKLIKAAHPKLSAQDAALTLFDKIAGMHPEGEEKVKMVFSRTTQTVLVSLPWPLNRDQFQIMTLNLARVTGNDNADMNEKEDGQGNSVASVEPCTLVEIDAPSSGTHTFVRLLGKGKTSEGYISSKLLRPLALEYDIQKETVLTNEMELSQLKVLSRLKKGDKVRALSLPVKSDKLLRMKAVVLTSQDSTSDATIGWLSMMGNNVDYISASR